MKSAQIPKDEILRLQALEEYQVLDTPPEQGFDDIAKIASHTCHAPVALISFIDKSRQWFKSTVGLEVAEAPRASSFCAHTILQEGVFIVADILKDERFHDSPLAARGPQMRFYAGAPLKSSSGHNVGTLCVMDHEPRDLPEGQRELLEALARQVVGLLEMRGLVEKAEGLEADPANEKTASQSGFNGLINLKSLYEQFEGAEEILGEIAEQCLDCLPQYVSDLEEALAEENGDALKASAHTIKGTVANFEATSVIEAASKLEAMAKTRDFRGAEEALEALKEQVSQLESFLKQIAAGKVA